MPEPTPSIPSAPDPSVLNGLNPEELFARGMQSVKMTRGAGLAADWEPPTIEETARLFPNYEVLEIVGRGGMGAVYRARQLTLDRTVAIKLLPLEVSADQDFAERFKREARTMARLSHPNIVSVFDFGTTTEGHLYFVMEYVEGTTLHQLIKSTGLKPHQALEIIVGVCEALNYAHTEGVVHRDVKPANVLVDVRGRVKVTDFGLARLSGPSAAEQAGYTVTGTVLGTPDYMAPEQKRGMHVDHRADIYSLGVMLYEMLCGQVPQGVFDLPSRLVPVDERVDQVVVRAMHQEPDRRYQNTQEMRNEVQTISVAKSPNAKAPRPRGSRRHMAAMALAGVAVAAVLVSVFLKSKGSRLPIHDASAARASSSADSPAALSAKGVARSEAPAAPEPESSGVGPPKTAPAPEPKVAVANPPAAVEPNAGAPKPNVEGNPAPVVPPIRPVEPRPVSNPEMSNAVAQVGPDPTPAVGTETTPAPVLEPWQRLADRAESLVKRRDPEGAIQAYEQAVDAAELSETPVAAAEIARLCFKMGSLEVALGSTAEARGSFERGKRVIQDAKGAGKLPPEAIQVLADIEGVLRRLPRDE